jgi:gamma-glutamylaminecyclotransferase
MRVFVYGSLMSGFHNHRLLQGPGAEFVRADRTAETACVMHDLGAYPAVVLAAGPGRAPVVGEVYEVDAATLARLDRLEGYPRLYDRKEVRLEGGGFAWMYVMREAPSGSPAVAGNDWWAHRATPRARA